MTTSWIGRFVDELRQTDSSSLSLKELDAIGESLSDLGIPKDEIADEWGALQADILRNEIEQADLDGLFRIRSSHEVSPVWTSVSKDWTMRVEDRLGEAISTFAFLGELDSLASDWGRGHFEGWPDMKSQWEAREVEILEGAIAVASLDGLSLLEHQQSTRLGWPEVEAGWASRVALLLSERLKSVTNLSSLDRLADAWLSSNDGQEGFSAEGMTEEEAAEIERELISNDGQEGFSAEGMTEEEAAEIERYVMGMTKADYDALWAKVEGALSVMDLMGDSDFVPTEVRDREKVTPGQVAQRPWEITVPLLAEFRAREIAILEGLISNGDQSVLIALERKAKHRIGWTRVERAWAQRVVAGSGVEPGLQVSTALHLYVLDALGRAYGILGRWDEVRAEWEAHEVELLKVMLEAASTSELLEKIWNHNRLRTGWGAAFSRARNPFILLSTWEPTVEKQAREMRVRIANEQAREVRKRQIAEEGKALEVINSEEFRSDLREVISSGRWDYYLKAEPSALDRFLVYFIAERRVNPLGLQSADQAKRDVLLLKFERYMMEENTWQANNLRRRLKPYLSERTDKTLASRTYDLDGS